MLMNTELNDANLVDAISDKIIPVAANSIIPVAAMKVCKFSKGELIVIRELRSKQMLGNREAMRDFT